MKNITLKSILDHAMKGGTFTYASYDHHKAVSEYKETQEYKSKYGESVFLRDLEPYKYDIPEEIRNKHVVMRQGKLRQVEFANVPGKIYRVKIGNKYSISFYDLPEGNLNAKIVFNDL